MVKNLTGKRIKFFHSDRGSEFTSKEFDEFLAEEGVIRKTSAPKTPQQNGVAERMNQTLLGGARAMLEHSRMTKGFWAEVLGTTAHIANWCPHKGLGWWTPFKLLFGRTPDISYFWIFGCHVWKFNEEAKKWDPKALPMVLIGYEPVSKVYRLWDPKSCKIVVSANVRFTETELPYQSPKPAPPAPTPKPPVPSSSKVKLPDLSSISWSFFDDSDEDSPKPKPSHPPKSPTPDGPSDSDLNPDNVYDNDDDQDVTPPPKTGQFPTPPSDSPKPDTPSKSSSSDDEPEVPGALNPEGGARRSRRKRKQTEKYC